MSITTAKSNNMKSYLKVLVMFLITIIIALLPPFGAITPLGMKVLGVFVGVLYGWCVLDTLWVSIYAMVILGVLFNNVLGTFGSGFSNQITLMCLITAILGGALDSLKITDLLCNWCLTRDFLKGRPWALVSMILVAGALIGALASSIAGTFLLWVIILRLADICNYEKGCKEMAFLLGMVVIVPAVASNCIPFQPGAIFFCSFLTQGTGLTVGYGSFLIYQLTISALVFIAVVLLGKFVWKLDFSRFNISEEMREELLNQKVTYEQKVGLISVLAFFILLLAPGILPKTIPGMALLSKLGIVGVGGILLVILTIMRNSEGKSLINLNTCHHAVPWNVVWLMAAIAPLSDALKSADTGIMATITQMTMPIFQNISMTALYIGSAVILCLLTQVSVNMVLGAVFIPFLTSICAQLGGNPYILFMMLYVGINMAFLTPAASAYGALMHGHDWVKGKNGYIIGAVNMIVTLIILSVVGIPLGNLLF